MEEEKLIVRCKQHTSLRQGWKNCLCGGSGFLNSKENKDK